MEEIWLGKGLGSGSFPVVGLADIPCFSGFPPCAGFAAS
jgi:hypothetical protein